MHSTQSAAGLIKIYEQFSGFSAKKWFQKDQKEKF